MDSITIVGPESAITAIPEILGFRPRESLVLLWVAHKCVVLGQRVDLPRGARHAGSIDSWGRDVVDYARHSHASAVLDVWVCGAPPPEDMVSSIHRALRRLGIDRIASIATDGDGWYSEGTPFTVVHCLPATLRWTGPERDEFQVDPIGPSYLTLVADQLSEEQLDRVTAQLLETVDSHVTEVAAEDGSLIITALRDVRVRDSLLWHLSQDPSRPRHAADLISRLLRLTPGGISTHLAITCAMAYWMAGDGFRASVALDRCLREDADHVLGQMLAAALAAGVPPTTWAREIREMPLSACRSPEPDCGTRQRPCNVVAGQETQRIAPAS